ncbi:MAG: radical SAM family heme chaperone HemW [Alphaproteobacteria bacterium]|nr:radical SAM family heme chaperone HemW [Alphaproteobacteria bacterium]
MNKAHNIYIHVPFCVAKCRYCAFFSRACSAPDWDQYVSNINQEIRLFSRQLGKISVPTIFFGGGTPSLMPTKVFDSILTEIRKNLNLAPDAEITIEANPKTIDDNKISEFAKIGMNRISIGVQSFDDEKLKFLGRIHSADDARRTLDGALRHGLRVSADFIYGLPNETVAAVIKTCQEINSIGLSHCSMYELTIEPNTPLGQSNPEMPDNETMADMYNAINDNLCLPRYEVSNYAVPGQECRHNQNVWDGEPYIGIGTGAAGRVLLNGVWYEQLGGNKQFEPMSDADRAIERVITGLRTVRGVKLDEHVKNIINLEFAKSCPDMLSFNGDRLAATAKGMLVLDDLITKLVK